MYLICLSEIQKHYKDIILNSGRMVFRMGRYNQCIQTPGMDYQMAFIGIKDGDADPDAASFFMGVCLPQHCTADMTRYALNKLITQAQLPFSVMDVNNHIPDQAQPYNWVFMFTVCLISMLFSLMLVASCSKTAQKHRYLSAFSIQNSLKTLEYNPNSSLNTLNGIRALAMLWVILGHEYSLILTQVSNALTWNSKLYSWSYLVVEAGLFAVDTFFFVGGFLVAYIFLREHSHHIVKYPLAVLNRYLRIVPSYFLAILLYYSVMKHLGSGPFWKFQASDTQHCDSMWRALVFIDNFVDNGQNQCMGWGWYLQVDMQLFIYSMFLLLILTKSRFWGYIAVFISNAAVFAFTMTYTFENENKNGTHMSDFVTFQQYMSDIYVKPYGRAPPYLYGLLLGVFYSDFVKAEKNSQKRSIISENSNDQQQNEGSFFLNLKEIFLKNVLFRRCFEIFGIILGSFLVFIPRTAQGDDKFWPQLSHSLYLTYSKLFFVVSLSFIILPSLLGINSIVRFVLDTKFFSWIAKVSFWAYLIHLTLLIITFGSLQYQFYYDLRTEYGLFVSHSVLSLTLGFMFSILIELPFGKLQKILMKSLMKKKHKPERRMMKEQDEDEKKQKLSQIKDEIDSMAVNKSSINDQKALLGLNASRTQEEQELHFPKDIQKPRQKIQP